jgi:nucleotide-binding universal stress UspA family protein
MISLKRILVVTDFGEAADAALAYGRALAREFGASLHLLHVLENPFMRAISGDPHAIEAAAMKQLNSLLAADHGETHHSYAAIDTSDLPAEAIVRYAKAEGIDLVVMGTHGRQGVAHALVGSVAERVVRTAPCPVLTVRHPEHEFVMPEDHDARPHARPLPIDSLIEASHDCTQKDSRRH